MAASNVRRIHAGIRLPEEAANANNPAKVDLKSKDYKRWQKDHRSEILGQAMADMHSATARFSSLKAPASVLAAATGLSEGTIRQYVRKKKHGSRGPLLTTYLALKNASSNSGNR